MNIDNLFLYLFYAGLSFLIFLIDSYIGLLSAIYLEKVKAKSFSFYLVVVSIFTVVFIHNFSAMLSHFEQIKFNVF